MRLDRISIQNFRSLIDVDVSLNRHLSVLVGPNGSGKTNFLKAIFACSNLLRSGSRYQRAGPSDDFLSESKFTLSLSEKKRQVVVESSVVTSPGENADEVFVHSDEIWKFFDGGKSSGWKSFGASEKQRQMLFFAKDYFRHTGHHVSGSVRQRSLPFDDSDFQKGFLENYRAVANFLESTQYYSASQFTDPSRCPVSLELDKDDLYRTGTRSRIGGHRRFLLDLYSHKDSAVFEEYLSVVGPKGMGLVSNIFFRDITISSVDYNVRIGGQLQERKKEKVLVIPQFEVGKNVLSPNQLSEGTLKTISLAFYLMTNESSLLLIEEPEVCVHHGLLSSIMELITQYSEEKQVIISTHSDFILDTVNAQDVYRVSNDPELGTSITQLNDSMDDDEKDALKDYLENVGSLGEYWKHGGF